MTYAELSQRMSNAEFELWIAEFSLRDVECPQCGHEARDLETHQLFKHRCPVCRADYARVRPSTWAEKLRT